MSNKQLDPTIEDFLSTFEETSRKEIKYILDPKNDWTKILERGIRESRHDLEVLLVDRNTLTAEKLFTLCKGDTKHPRVKSALDLLIKFFKIYEERKEKYLRDEDWTLYELDGKKDTDIRAEIEFQSEILKNVSKYKEKLRKINFGEDSAVVDIQIFGNISIPLMMSDIIEERYPEIKDFLLKKRESFYSSAAEKPKVVNKRAPRTKKD